MTWILWFSIDVYDNLCESLFSIVVCGPLSKEEALDACRTRILASKNLHPGRVYIESVIRIDPAQSFSALIHLQQDGGVVINAMPEKCSGVDSEDVEDQDDEGVIEPFLVLGGGE